MRGAEHEEIHSQRRGEIEDRRRRFVAYRIDRQHRDADFLTELQHEHMIAAACGSSCHLGRPAFRVGPPRKIATSFT